MSEFDQSTTDPILDSALDRLVERKARRAVASAPTLAGVVAKSRSARIRARRRLVTIVAVGAVLLAGAAVGLGLGGLGTHALVGVSPSQSPSEDEIAALHRPLQVPVLAADGACPVTPVGLTLSGGLGVFQGAGPVRVDNLDGVTINDLPLHDGWYGQKVFWAVDAREPGPILVRVARLDGQGGIGLGPTLGSELVLSNDSIGPYSAVGTEPPFPLKRIFVDGVSFREPGCYFMQMDGPATTSTVVFRALGPGASPQATSSPAASEGVVVQVLTSVPGLSASAAEALAREHVSPDLVLTRAAGGRLDAAYDPVGPSEPLPGDPSRLVWVVTFAASVVVCPPPFVASDGAPETHPCSSPRPATTNVILDYVTGSFIEATSYSPGS